MEVMVLVVVVVVVEKQQGLAGSRSIFSVPKRTPQNREPAWPGRSNGPIFEPPEQRLNNMAWPNHKAHFRHTFHPPPMSKRDV